MFVRIVHNGPLISGTGNEETPITRGFEAKSVNLTFHEMSADYLDVAPVAVQLSALRLHPGTTIQSIPVALVDGQTMLQ